MQKKKRDKTKIWAKTVKGEKITRSILYDMKEPYEADKLYEYTIAITKMLDVPTPLILESHKFNFQHYNSVKFRASEFVETVDFDYLVFENAYYEETEKERKDGLEATKGYTE